MPKDRSSLSIVLAVIAILMIVGGVTRFLYLISARTSRSVVEDSPTSNSVSEDSQTVQSGSAIEIAKERRDTKRECIREAKRYGIDVLLSSEAEAYILIRDRLRSNQRLADAAMLARKNGINVIPGKKFWIGGSGGVWIDVRASDEEIIEFLIGK